MLKNIKFFIVFLILGWSIFSCSKLFEEEEEVNVIKVGVLLTYTGELGGDGIAQSNAIKLAFKEVNDAGGLLGKNVRIIEANTKTDPNTIGDALDYLVNEEKVIAVIGPVTSSEMQEAFEFIKNNPRKVVIISTSATSPAITEFDDDGWIWRSCPSDAFQGNLLAEKIIENNCDTLGIIYIDNVYGSKLAEVLKNRYEELGGYVAFVMGYPEGKTSGFDDIVDSVKIKKPEGLVLISYYEDGAQLTREISMNLPSGYKPKMFGSDGIYGETFVENADLSLIEGMIGTCPGADTSDKSFKYFSSQYVKNFGYEILPYTQNAYDNAYLIALAILKARSFVPEDIKNNLIRVSGPGGEKIYAGEFSKAKQVIEQGGEIDYHGASGEIDFDANGDPTWGTYYIWKIENGKIKIIETVTYHSGERR